MQLKWRENHCSRVQQEMQAATRVAASDKGVLRIKIFTITNIQTDTLEHMRVEERMISKPHTYACN